ncbi:HNH endonuclease [Thermomonas mangrovi]|uniref:HNH endonuclease n=1 Tax=Thermomonas mangrovi TaxID=2993316 RepID=UPI002306E949|nr:hypothetical protein [Thermomonas mangrovi]
MFAQGGLCFFCSAPLPKSEASVEHLVASSRAGSNSDDNCVACCKAMNGLLGSMSLKEKIKVVLNQKGQFKCPNGIGNPPTKQVAKQPGKVKVIVEPAATTAPQASPGQANPNEVSPEKIIKVIENLKSRGNARPKHLSSLKATLRALASLKLTLPQVVYVLEQLQAGGKISIDSSEIVTYKL